MSEVLDAVDAKILDLIQHDAGLSVAEIADRVGLSSSCYLAKYEAMSYRVPGNWCRAKKAGSFRQSTRIEANGKERHRGGDPMGR